MRNGYKIIDMDTHVQPPLEVLEKYVDPSLRPRLKELDPYRRPSVGKDGVTRSRLNVGAIAYDRFPGQAPREEDQRPTPGGRHRYIRDYTAKAPNRLKSAAQVSGADVEWAVQEIRSLAHEKWLAAVWLHLPEGKPIDHPDFEPLWATLNELDLPLVHHSFFMEPPYFPGYRDIWGNTVVARTAAHPWGAARLCAYLILSGLFDRYPNLRAAASEVGHGWLPNWVIRLGFNNSYVTGVTPKLRYTPLEYVQMGRFRCAAEPFEGPAMTKACIEILGEDVLMHQSDYPHGQSFFPETAGEVMGWPIWSSFGEHALRKHMCDNAAKFLRLI
ncbi:MAG: amidohydrolase family protein [Nitrospinae bacterium]|nr:amidohydrolase family protein [Nitrospinota bacterium]